MKLKNYSLLFLFIVVIVFYFTIDPNEVDFMLKCPLYKTTGIYCPGCGSQRATHHLLHFNFDKALQSNVLFILGIPIVSYHYAIPIVNSTFNTKYQSIFDSTRNLVVLLVLIIIFWVLRNIPQYPFTLLAP